MAYIISVCPECNEQNFPEASYCIKCGHSLLDVPLSKINLKSGETTIVERHRSIQICPECNWENPGGFTECGKCHHSFSPHKKATKSGRKTKDYNPQVAVTLAEEVADPEPPVLLAIPKTANNHNIRNTVIGLGVFSFIFLYSPISDLATVAYSNQTAAPNIKEIADNSGLNTKGKALFYRSKPELVTANTLSVRCDITNSKVTEYGCYLPKENKMYILQVSDPNYAEAEYDTAVHETMHIVWLKMSSSERAAVYTELQQFIADKNNTEGTRVQGLLSTYGSDPLVLTNEEHSFVGSSVQDAYLSEPLKSHYYKYFSDRTYIVRAQANFDSKLDAKRSELNTESASLDVAFDELGAFKKQWVDRLLDATNRSADYGDSVTYYKNLAAYKNNLAIYNKKVDQYKVRADKFNAEVDKYNALIHSFQPTQSQLKTQE